MKKLFFLVSSVLVLTTSAIASTKALYLVITDDFGKSSVAAIDVSTNYTKDKNVMAAVKQESMTYEFDLLSCTRSSCLASITINSLENDKSTMSTLVYSYDNHKSFYTSLTVLKSDGMSTSFLVMSYTMYENLRKMEPSLPGQVMAIAPSMSNLPPANGNGNFDFSLMRENYLYYGPVQMQGGPLDPR